MDHHCPWTANCIGYYNYKFFFLKLFYTTSIYVYYSLTSLYASFFHPDPYSILPRYIYFPQLVVWVLYSFANLPMVSMLFGFIGLFSWSSTNVEAAKGSLFGRGICNSCCPGEDSASMYQLGVFHHARRLLGKWVFLWFLPINFSTRSGFEFDGRPAHIFEEQRKESMLNKPLDPEKYMAKIMEKVEKRAGGKELFYEDIARINNIN